jgi:hypothetical protein
MWNLTHKSIPNDTTTISNIVVNNFSIVIKMFSINDLILVGQKQNLKSFKFFFRFCQCIILSLHYSKTKNNIWKGRRSIFTLHAVMQNLKRPSLPKRKK